LRASLGSARINTFSYETGVKLAPKPLLARMAKYFGVPPLWFYPNFSRSKSGLAALLA